MHGFSCVGHFRIVTKYKSPLIGLIFKQNSDLEGNISGLHLRRAYHLESARHSKNYMDCT